MATRSAPLIPPFRPRARTQFWNYPRPYRTGFKAWLPSWRFIVGVMLSGVALGAGVFMAAWTSITVGEEVSSATLETSTVNFAGKGGKMGEFEAEQDRKIVTVDDLPVWVANAPVASEEQNFYSASNLGISPRGILRAMVTGVGGGSTLTQQYVEQYFVGWDPNPSIVDKFEEMILAMKIRQNEEDYPPEKILDGYLNVINLGRSSYGIQAAAQAYYGKDAKDLSPSESAFLAGIIPSPNRYDNVANGPAWAEGRWERTINLMHEQGYVEDDQYEKALADGFPTPKKFERSSSWSGTTGYLMSEIEKELAAHGFDVSRLVKDGLVVETTIDKKLQKAAVKAATLPEGANPNTRSSLVSMDPKTGAIKAMYGGPDYAKEEYRKNAATDEWQQGGSTYKPFTLIAALESGIPLGQYYNGDEPQTFDYYTAPDDNDVEQPQPVTNFGNVDFGNINLVEATTHSVNTVYVQLNHDATPQKSQEVAKELGLASEGTIAYRKWEALENPDEPIGETSDQMSNVLGTPYVYTYDLARAYSTIANQGVRTTPHLVNRIMDPDRPEGDNVVYEADFPEERSSIDPQSIANATYAMSQVVDDPEGSGNFARTRIPEERPLAGKTGTSNSNLSAWFAGFTPQLATVVGMYETNDKGGFKSITPFGEFAQITGGSWPVQAWTSYMAPALEGMPIEPFPEYVYEEPTPPPSPTPDLEMVMVPTGLEGQPWAQVQAQLSALGLNAQPSEVEAPQYGPETVVAVSQAGQEVETGSTIEVQITGGEETSTVPNVVGMNENQARVALQQAGFGMQPNYVSGEQPSGTVIDQRPGPDQQLPQEQTVTVDVSDGSGGEPGGDSTCAIWEDCDDSTGEPSSEPTADRPPGPNGNAAGNDQ